MQHIHSTLYSRQGIFWSHRLQLLNIYEILYCGLLEASSSLLTGIADVAHGEGINIIQFATSTFCKNSICASSLSRHIR